MRLKNSFWALLGQSKTEPSEAVLERVCQAIQAALDEHLDQDGLELKLRVRFARDIETLWYLRPDIMSAIATHRGEATARKCINDLTVLFKNYRPSAAVSRLGAP